MATTNLSADKVSMSINLINKMNDARRAYEEFNLENFLQTTSDDVDSTEEINVATLISFKNGDHILIKARGTYFNKIVTLYKGVTTVYSNIKHKGSIATEIEPKIKGLGVNPGILFNFKLLINMRSTLGISYDHFVRDIAYSFSGQPYRTHNLIYR